MFLDQTHALLPEWNIDRIKEYIFIHGCRSLSWEEKYYITQNPCLFQILIIVDPNFICCGTHSVVITDQILSDAIKYNSMTRTEIFQDPNIIDLYTKRKQSTSISELSGSFCYILNDPEYPLGLFYSMIIHDHTGRIDKIGEKTIRQIISLDIDKILDILPNFADNYRSHIPLVQIIKNIEDVVRKIDNIRSDKHHTLPSENLIRLHIVFNKLEQNIKSKIQSELNTQSK